MTTPAELTAFNTGTARARAAYAADSAVRDGFCAWCRTRKVRRPDRRTCDTCQRARSAA